MSELAASQVRQAVIATGRSLINSAVYSNAWIGATYALFKSRRAGDCSDFTAAVFEPHGYKLPGMSWQQASAGTEVARWSGARGGGIAAFNAIKSKLRPADIVCMSLQGSTGISHVNLNVDGTTALDHGGPGRGPRLLRYDDRWLLGDATQWIVRRIIPDDKPGTATETDTTPASPAIETKDDEMFIIKSPNRPHALIGPGRFHKFRNSEELKVVSGTLKPTIKDALNDREYDVLKAVFK